MRKASKFLKHYLKPFRLQISIVLISIIFVSSAILGLGYALRFLIDQGFAGHNPQQLNHAFMLLIAMIALLSVASYNRSRRVNWICAQLEANIKKQAFNNIVKISPSYFELNKVSDILSRLTNDLNLVSNSITMLASSALRNAIMVIGGFIMLLLSSFKLTSYVLLALPLVLLPIIIVGRRIRKLSKDNQHNIANCNAHIEETFSFIKIVQAYNREKFESNRFTQLLDDTLSLANKRIHLRSLFFATAIGLILSAVAFVLWIGGHDVLSGKMTAGALSSFIFYAVLVASSLGSLSETYGDIATALGAVDRVAEVINAKSNILENSHPISLNKAEALSIQIENLSFCYPSRPETKVLDQLNFTINDYQNIAIVGPSGAGKSSIFQLLLRFYDPNDGVIKLNNIDIKNLSLDELRSQFALVSQDPIIFSASAYENILYGDIKASRQQVEEAAKAAEIYDFFMSLPDGLDTYLGEKGMKISGGQKQRIAIARAILRNPKILLLDEATSSLDSENEKLVQIALTRLRKNRTSLVIAHRISTIINADMIILLDKGKLVALGDHAQLLKTSELYQRLCTNL